MEEKTLIELAAATENQPVSEFIWQTVLPAARERVAAVLESDRNPSGETNN